ncbi:MAG: L-histidine N(alpha)-methyltransferase [Spirochaetota bacterium]|nr:L-histidine N(alpha)-methyltransferase [Spirochaetota bacterium]
MTSQYQILQSGDVEVAKSQQEFAKDILFGLSQPQKCLPSRYIYDTQGSKLFQQIMELPEYYLTQCETEVLHRHKDTITDFFESNSFNLVELGAGDGKKTKILLSHFLENNLDFQYVPIDISETAIHELLDELNQEFCELESRGLVAEYFEGLNWLSNLNHRCNVVLFLGSNIGNFKPFEARDFLLCLWNALNDGDYVLIGLDLKKEIEMLLGAYNDSQGITAKYNLNILDRINYELDGNFDLDNFEYYCTYDVSCGAIHSFLVSQREQTVSIGALNRMFHFEAWEAIHTESSYKFLEKDFSTLAEETGYEVIGNLYDSRRYFVDSLWQVNKM